MCDICGLDGFRVLFPAQVSRSRCRGCKEREGTPSFATRPVLPSEKVGEGGTRLNSLGLWWIRCFWAAQGSLAKLHGETNPGECSCIQKVWEGWPMAKFPGALVDKWL